MAYIGKQPVVGNFVKLDAITTSATATYNLLNGGVAYFPQTANNCIVSLNGVIQSPTSAYTISGSTIVFSDALTASDSIDFILVLGDVLNIGTPSDGTITSAKLASGTAGLIAWQSIVTAATLTAVSGRGYWIDTTSNACTVTLPASATAGDTIILVDYARNWQTNAVTINTNSLNFQGNTTPNPVYNTNAQSVTLVYSGATKGWIPTVDDNVTLETPQNYSVDFLVVAGGGGGCVGGAGAGGFRTSTQTVSPGTVITITVGDGGAGTSTGTKGVNGSDSSISGSGLTTITSAGGGGGASLGSVALATGANGGSGGGGSRNGGDRLGGSGNTPSTSPSQGNNGGLGKEAAPNYGSGGGGGAGAVGADATNTTGGNGGNGTASSITGSSVTYAGGGGGSTNTGGTAGTGGTGGGGAGITGSVGTGNSGTANTGGGGGGREDGTGGSGGKGIVILSIPTASYTGTITGSPTESTSGSNKILQFTGSGSYTA
jgi:hypothetical protein